MRSLSAVGRSLCVGIVASVFAAAPLEAVVIYSEDFSGYTGVLPGNLTTTNPPSTPTGTRGFGTAVTASTNGGGANPRDLVQVTTAGNLFGAGNNYLNYVENVGTASSASNIQTADITGLGEGGPAQLSLKFYIPNGGLKLDGNGAAVNGIVVLLTDGTTADANKRTVSLEFRMADTDGDLDLEPAFVFQGGGTPYIPINFDQVYDVKVAANYSTSNSITYSLGAQSIAPTTYDVWLDGVKVRDDVNFRSTTLNLQDPVANPIVGDADRLTIRATGSTADATVNLDDIEIRSSIVLGLPTVNVNRTTGSISLVNNSGAAVGNIVGYTITSAAGTLNSSDAVWNSVQDGDSRWNELALEDGTDVSESNLNSTPAPITLANNSTRNFGNIWYKHYQEDVQFKLLIDDGSANGLVVPLEVNFIGGTGAYPQGDINFDGLVNAADVTKFAQSFNLPLAGTAPGATYALGDFTGDLTNNYADLVAFRAIYDAANGPGAFSLAMTTIPEPSSVITLAVLLGGAGVWRWFPWGARKAAFALLALLAVPNFANATIVFQENFDAITAGETISTNNAACTTIVSSATTPHTLQAVDDASDLFSNMPGNLYLQMVDGGTGNPRAVGPADLSTAKGFQLSFDFVDTLAATENMRLGLGNAAGDNNQATVDFEFRGTGFGYRGTPIATSYNIHQKYHILAIGNYGDKPLIYNNSESVGPRTFDVWLDGVRITDNEAMSNQPVSGTLKSTHLNVRAGSSTGTGDINFDNILVENAISAFSVQGEASLTLEVNTTNGQMQIKNTFTQLPIALDYYKISGAAGSLNRNNWNSLDDQDGPDAADAGWIETTGSNAVISEFTLDGSESSVASGSPLSLGAAYNTASGAANSLVFEYALDGGAVLTGLVSLVTSTTLHGDFNHDGLVNLADYTVWRDNLGNGSDTVINNAGDGVAGVTAGDYNVWKSNFGNSSGALAAVSSAVVPEPSSLLLGVFSTLAVVGLVRRRR